MIPSRIAGNSCDTMTIDHDDVNYVVTIMVVMTSLLVTLMMLDWEGRAEVQLVENALLDLGSGKKCATKIVADLKMGKWGKMVLSSVPIRQPLLFKRETLGW